MEMVPYILMQDRLSTGGSFILCDSNAMGFPIRYASTGFCELFGYTAVECKGQKCGDLVAEPSIRANDPGLKDLAASTGLSPEAADEALAQMTKYAAKECKAMMAHPTELTGFALVPNRAKNGKLKVVELAMVVCRHPNAGWLYTVGLQTDVSQEVPLQKLFGAMANGTYADLVKAQEPAMKTRLRLLDLGGGVASQYLDVKATEMWETLMLDALGVQAKALSDVSSKFSTTDGTSTDGSSSWEDSDTQSSANGEEALVPGAPERRLPPVAEEQPVRKDDFSKEDMFRQVSDASTFIPESELQAFSRHGTDDVVSSPASPTRNTEINGPKSASPSSAQASPSPRSTPSSRLSSAEFALGGAAALGLAVVAGGLLWRGLKQRK